MLRKFVLILGIILLPSLALAAFVPLPVNQGGTGWGYPGGLESGRIIFGSGTSRVGTSTNLFWDNTNSRLGVGSSTPGFKFSIGSGLTGFSFSDSGTSSIPYASTTALSAASLCLTGDTCRTTWPSSSGGGTGNVATSSSETATYVPFWTSTAANTATLSGGNSSFTWNNTVGRLIFPYATTTYITASTASTTNLRVSGSTTFESLGTGLAKITSGVLGLATAGVDYLASYDAWTHPYSGASATTSDIIITGKLGVGTSTPLRDLDVLGTFSFGLQDSPLKKAEWTNLRYGESKLISGGDISYSGAADNWSVGSTTAEVNGRFWSSDSINGTVATSTFMIANKSVKDPFIYKEGSTYYAFYTVVSNSLGITDSDLGYATSQDLKNWTDQGVLINHTSWWGGSTLPVWAPSVIKVGSTYYMFVTTLDGGSFKMGYATASSLTGTYTFVDYVKDSGGSVINYLDPHVVYYNGLYYMVAGNGNIKLWTATSLSANSWTLKSTLAAITRNWENTDGVFEAPYLVPGTPNLLFYGASGSHDDQRIGLAISDHIDGPYTKVGVDGQVFLDFPSEAVGPIDHPAVYYDKESSRWYLFASHGTTAGGHLFQRLAGYWSSDLSNWQSIATSSQLKPGVTNYVYVNPSGQLMAAADLPYDSGRDGTFPERQGYLRLGTLTVNSSRQVTSSSAFQGKKTMLDWFGIGTSTPGTPLSVTGEGVFTGRVTAPSYNATSTTAASTFPYASTTAVTIGGSGPSFIISSGNGGWGTTSPGTKISIGDTGNSTINISETASSTFGTGINLRTGCFAIAGTCLNNIVSVSSPLSLASGILSLGNVKQYPAFTYSTSTAWTGTTTIPLGPAYVAETWNGIQCFTDTGTVGVSFYDGTNRMNYIPTASTTVNINLLTTNNSFTASEKRYVDIGNPASTPTSISCTVSKTMFIN